MGQYDLAVTQLHNVMELDRDYFLTYLYLALSYIETGHHHNAIQAIEMAVPITQSTVVQLYLGYIYAMAGRIPEARQILKDLEELAQETYVPAVVFSGIHAGLGEIGKSIEYLENAYEEGHPLITHFVLRPFHGQLRSHPRYQALLRKMNLEP